ncbi:MAG: ABC transporter ATP-binding protein [Gammaproteobacteria bacterium]|nr:ABC transporter ATP-binding protein [Gammaproteobacteria bacterium]
MTIVCENVIKEFGSPPTRILHDISLSVADGEFVSISGKSGSGKSTLLYILSTLDLPSRGRLLIDGVDMASIGVEQLHEFRNQQVGFVFQFHYLLPELTAIENVLLPARKTKQHEKKRDYALSLFERFDIAGKTDKLPSQLSGGEQQRVAIIRALIMRPRYLFADEPTGNLDSKNGEIVMGMLKQANEENHTTLILVTHEPEYASMANREVFLHDGRLEKASI